MLSYREADKNDARLLFKWANDAEVRGQAFNVEKISWEEHQKWLQKKMCSSNTKIFILKDGDQSVGQVRLDWDNDQKAIIDVSIDSACRGRGYGGQGIKLISEAVVMRGLVKEIVAYVKTDNQASYRSFLKAGYHNDEQKCFNGVEVYQLSYRVEGDQ